MRGSWQRRLDGCRHGQACPSLRPIVNGLPVGWLRLRCGQAGSCRLLAGATGRCGCSTAGCTVFVTSQQTCTR